MDFSGIPVTVNGVVNTLYLDYNGGSGYPQGENILIVWNVGTQQQTSVFEWPNSGNYWTGGLQTPTFQPGTYPSTSMYAGGIVNGPSTLVIAPSTGVYWNVVAKAGTNGLDGAPGAPGAPGINGKKGDKGPTR